jgi:chromosomal replication initiator protein
MSAMEKLAAQENMAVKRSWSGGELHQEVKSEIPQALKEIDFRCADTMREIIDIVSYEVGVSRDDILGDRRFRVITRARQYAMWKCRKQGYSLPQIGHVFGRDHTTVAHGCRVIDEIMSEREGRV